ncbi:MAG TPA: hypothetical protein P5307_10105 [Pirellulaceae bacterium]|nr:hypothetical protein [Planctomycetales bacterium]HRX79402.1 hypothetical protein [Pirellulaceae bacterium]
MSDSPHSVEARKHQPISLAIGAVVAVVVLLANVHGAWLIPEEDRQGEEAYVISALKFGWPMTYVIRDLGPTSEMQWIFKGAYARKNLNPVALMLNIPLCVIPVLSSVLLFDQLLTRATMRIRFGLRSLLGFMTSFAFFLAVFLYSFPYSIHWFSFAADWPNYVLLWVINAILSFGTTCIAVTGWQLLLGHYRARRATGRRAHPTSHRTQRP